MKPAMYRAVWWIAIIAVPIGLVTYWGNPIHNVQHNALTISMAWSYAIWIIWLWLCLGGLLELFGQWTARAIPIRSMYPAQWMASWGWSATPLARPRSPMDLRLLEFRRVLWPASAPLQLCAQRRAAHRRYTQTFSAAYIKNSAIRQRPRNYSDHIRAAYWLDAAARHWAVYTTMHLVASVQSARRLYVWATDGQVSMDLWRRDESKDMKQEGLNCWYVQKDEVTARQIARVVDVLDEGIMTQRLRDLAFLMPKGQCFIDGYPSLLWLRPGIQFPYPALELFDAQEVCRWLQHTPWIDSLQIITLEDMPPDLHAHRRLVAMSKLWNTPVCDSSKVNVIVTNRTLKSSEAIDLDPENMVWLGSIES